MEQTIGSPPMAEIEAPRQPHYKGRYSRIGLDLGTGQVKIAQLRQARGRIELSQYAIFPLPEGSIQGGRVVDPAILADRLKWIARRRRLRTNRVNISLGSQAVILRQVQLPKMSPREIPAALRWEAEKQVMIPLDEAVMDYIYMGERVVEDREVIELTLVAAPRDVVNGYLEVVTRAGLYPEVVDIEPLVLQRVFSHYRDFSMTDDPGAVILLDVGAESSNLVVLEKGQFSFSRALSVGSNHFIRRVSDLQGVKIETAGRLVFGGDPFAASGVQETADELLTQVRRSLEYYTYNMGHEDKEFRVLYLCGGGAFIDRLAAFLGIEMKMEPKPLNPLSFMESSPRFWGDLEKEAGMLNVAVGLALRGWQR